MSLISQLNVSTSGIKPLNSTYLGNSPHVDRITKLAEKMNEIHVLISR